MRSVERWRALVALAATAAAASAPASPELARAHACMACHAVEQKVVGPSFVDIAKRHRQTSGAASLLAKHIREGVRGAWGEIPMPAHPQLSAADADTLANWVLSTAGP
jgi:cytochrome c